MRLILIILTASGEIAMLMNIKISWLHHIPGECEIVWNELTEYCTVWAKLGSIMPKIVKNELSEGKNEGLAH